MEQKLAWIATRDHGVVDRPELLSAGISSDQIAWRLRTGALIREYPGVYRVGHAAPSVEAAYMAAVKACGPGAVLSGRAAAYHLGILKGAVPPPEVTAPTQRRVRGIKTRRCRRIHRRDVTKVRGIPVTTVPRTLVDIAPDLSLDDLARACHEAGVRYGTKPKHVEAVLAQRPNAPGAAKLRLVIRGDARATLSQLERGFEKLLGDAGIPLPQMNRPADGHRVDCRWAGRLTIELDSYRFHNSRHAWKHDRLREREARSREEEFRRYIWEDVFEDGEETVREVKALLSGP